MMNTSPISGTSNLQSTESPVSGVSPLTQRVNLVASLAFCALLATLDVFAA